jgi:TPR repeat protein
LAADQNHAKALFHLFEINSQKLRPVRYEYDAILERHNEIEDDSVDPSYIEPSKLLLKSAELGCPKAQEMIGSDYLYKTVRHGEDGSEVVLKSVEKGDCDVGEIEKGWEWKLKAANNGSDSAQLRLAERYEEGIHLPQPDMEKAIRWYKKAARKSPVAQYRLGIIYDEGKGVKQDKSMAAKYFIKATKSSYCGPEAQYRLGLLYVNGEGVERDMTKAVTLFLESVVSESYAPAQYELGYCYYKGMGVKQDDAKAMKWWLKAAKQGYSQAIKVVLNSYAMGDLGEKDEVKAACWQRAISSWSDTMI